MFIVQVKGFYLTKNAENNLPYSKYKEIESWLASWTCAGCIPVVLCNTIGEGIDEIRKIDIIPNFINVDKSNFEFEIIFQEVKNNKFWVNSGASDCKRYNFKG